MDKKEFAAARQEEDGPTEIELKEEWDVILSHNQDIIENDKDSVLTSLISSVERRWSTLNPSQKKEIIAHTVKLTSALRDYHDSYVNLKGTADERRELRFDDTEKYQETVKRADQQERILHNAFLDSLNILSRRMKEFGLDNSWRGMSIIYDTDNETMRDKVKLWMFRIFNEEIPKQGRTP